MREGAEEPAGDREAGKSRHGRAAGSVRCVRLPLRSEGRDGEGGREPGREAASCPVAMTTKRMPAAFGRPERPLPGRGAQHLRRLWALFGAAGRRRDLLVFLSASFVLGPLQSARVTRRVTYSEILPCYPLSAGPAGLGCSSKSSNVEAGGSLLCYYSLINRSKALHEYIRGVGRLVEDGGEVHLLWQ